MLREALIGLLIALEGLFLSAFHAAVDILFLPKVGLVESLHHKEVGLVAHHLRVDGVRSALAEREVVDGIEQIGLAHAVLPNKAVHIGRKLEVGLLDVLIVEYGEALQYHRREK